MQRLTPTANGESGMTARQTSKRHPWLANLAGRYKILVAVLPLLGMSLITGLITLQSQRAQEETRAWRGHTYEVLLAVDQIQQTQQAGVLAVDAYLLSLKAASLATLQDSRQATLRSVARLRELTHDNALQQMRLDRLQRLIAQETIVFDGSVAAATEGQHGATIGADRRLQLGADYLAARNAGAIESVALLDQMAATERSLLTIRSQRLDRALRISWFIIALGALAQLLFGWYAIRVANRLITDPVRQITDMMNRVAAHDTSVVVTRLERKDEIGELARALQVFKQMSLDAQSQNWIKTQASGISHVLLQATTHKEFAQWLTSELVPLCKAGVGLFYSFDDARQRLDLLGSYGLRLSNRTADHYMPGEGLVGQCAAERKAIMLDDVPADYLHIDSGSGEALPRHIAILPVLYRDTLIGVLELASFSPFPPLQLQLLDELLPMVALALENLTRAVSTRDLLLQTQEQTDELRVSELVMRQQKEVLRDNNDTLQAKTAELEEQSERLISSEEELRVQAEELQSSNEELREKTVSLNQQKHVLEELQQETEDKAEQLSRASQYKSEFLANMSHELRTPLNSLLILSRSLADNDTGNLDEEQIESARIIHDSGNSLLHLINDILDLSKIEAGKMELMLDELPLAALVQRLRRTFTHVAEQKGLGFTLEMAADVPAILRTDGSKLEQILNNLLSNAFKFTAEGAVTVRIDCAASDIAIPETLRDQPLVALAVTDTGIGIPKDKFQRVFNAFEQVDAGTSRQFGGTGLGLAISRSMAKLLGGDIVLRSESGRGSCFILLLPLTPPMASVDTEHAPAQPAARSSPHLLPDVIDDDRRSLVPGQVSILVIEDDPAFSRILVDMIRRKGYRALAAGDGASGLDLARQHRPTGILLDVMLPAMDGWTVMDRLKADPLTRTVPVHFISATDEASRGLELGAVGFLTKPVTREAIGTAFERLLHFAEGQQRHLLIVDDDEAARLAVRTTLRAQNVVIDEASTAEEALQLTERTRYDCIVLDLGLPGMSGEEFLGKLAQAAAGVPPVVIYSGRELSAEESLALRHYTDAIVVKGARSGERLLDEVSLFLHSIQHAPAPNAARSSADKELAGCRVLLVDDDMRNLFALSKVLRGWGVQVSMAQDGYKALKMLADEEEPELVLMDIMMPGMDGYETIQAIRAQSRFSTLPIIALTAKAMRGDREKCLAMGASDYLSKPIDIDRLGSMMRVWLQR